MIKKFRTWKQKKRAAAIATLKTDYISWRNVDPPGWLVFIQAYGTIISALVSVPVSVIITLIVLSLKG